mgnify:FL=1
MNKRMMIVLFFAMAAVFIISLTTKSGYSQTAKASNPADAGCLKCHDGIEKIADTPVMSKLTCVECHNGNQNGAAKEDAHKGMYANPTDLRVVDKTCGTCHAEDVSNSKKSLHATMAGMIGGTRYTWAAQDTKNSIYATYDVEDKDGNVPEKTGAVKSLKQLPMYDASKPMTKDNHPADDYLRDQCLRCHLWSKGAQQDGDYRASGCAACHVVYSDKGKYEGGDKAIDKVKAGRPKMHRITTKIPEYQCIHCHNRGGRTGVSYIGTMESDEYGSPWSGEAGKKGGKKLHGKFYNHLTADVHYQKGMTCIDCHTKHDLHGDGNIYNKKHQAMEIRCEDCHGDAKALSNLKTSSGKKLNNLKKEGGKVILTSKMDNKEKIVPQTKEVIFKGSSLAKSAMGIANHMNKMECYACHAKWAAQCYGCHAQQDTKTRSGDWINTKAMDDPSKGGNMEAKNKTTYKWSETRSYLRWESPVLGINQKGKVSPFIPGCQAIFTQIGADGKATMQNKVFTTYDGLSGFAHNPIQPHTISKEARTCEDCHANRKAVGLGTGIYNAKANGIDIPFELEQIIDKDGKQLQATSHYGARPFNKEEIDRIMRVNVCVSCHDLKKDAKIWKKATDVTGFAKTDAKHKEILKKLFSKGTGIKSK